LAEKAGAVLAAVLDAEGVTRLQRTLGDLTGGPVGGGAGGADHVFLAAGGSTNGPVELAVRLARDRARVVDIGKTKLDLPWNDYYEKELDLRFSRSYGPGRYDDRYELDGVDYPAGYVRWTERRNLGCFLDLVAGGSLDVGALIDGVHPIADAAAVYERLRSGELTGIGILFDYPTARPDQPARATEDPHAGGTGRRPRPTGPGGRVGIGFVGAGSYASSMLLPHLSRDATADLRTVATTRSLSAVNAQRSFGFQRVSTDPEDVLTDPAVAAVFVVTRHHSHADFVCRALEAGKAVFVEKPLALTYDEVDRVLATVARTGNDRLMVGFNRRFAPLLGHLRDGFANRGGDPLHVRYLVNAGTLSGGSWYLDSEREGSRWVGEGGHFVDVVSHLVGADPAAVTATGTGEDRHVSLEYPDGSVGIVSYLTTGSARFPKETVDVTGGGCSARLDNFVRATVWRGRSKEVNRSLLGQDKGQAAQLAAFLAAVRTGAPMPISLESLVATTRATLAGRSPAAPRRA
jgi:predicted dehydrogenase